MGIRIKIVRLSSIDHNHLVPLFFERKMTMKRKQVHDRTHLTLEERKIIQIGIENDSTKADIARTIGKDATTVAKEIRKHRKLKPRNIFNRPMVCEKMKTCSKKPCIKKCEEHEDPKCNRRDKSPGACNNCPKSKNCHWDKYFYNAQEADNEYRRDLVDFREGFNLTTKERDAIGETIAPLLNNGQSVYQVLSAHPEIIQCQKTIYTYIEAGLFKEQGAHNFSLKEQVNRKPRKTKLKKRNNTAHYNGRRYSDYLRFRTEHPDTPCVEMDTLYNNPGGPYLQTFIFERTAFMIGVIHKNITGESMSESIDILQAKLGNKLFSKLFPIILTDRGSEFETYRLFETDKDGNHRLNMFYCDPMQSSQKPHVENNHNYIRDIIPNGYPLDNITQNDIDLMFSHINGTPRLSLEGKTPYEMFCFFYGKETTNLLNTIEIERDNVILKPKLIFAKK
jgi:IS30 family transposase